MNINQISQNPDLVPPKVLDYTSIKPVGYNATQKLVRYYPINALGNASDVVRLIINSNGFWDPYSTYIKVKVSPILKG